MQSKRINSAILLVLNIPEADAEKTKESLRRYDAGDTNQINNAPKMQNKRSYLAWSLMIVFSDSPSKFMLSLLCIFFIMPTIFFIHLFS